MSEVAGDGAGLDSALWVVAHDGERGILLGNPHTHRGRFSVVWESTGRSHPTSLSDLAAMSDLSRAWLAGYLSGNEPDVYEALGLALDEEPARDDIERWRRMLAEFRSSGRRTWPITDPDDRH